MNFKLKLVHLIPLLTLIVGILAPLKYVQAAGSGSLNKETSKQETESIPELLVSKKAQQIEFFIFIGLITGCVVVPEFFYHPQRNHSRLKSNPQLYDYTEQDLAAAEEATRSSQKLTLISQQLEDDQNQNESA